MHRSSSRVDRMYLTNLWGRPNSPVEKRKYRLGQHGKLPRRKVSNYGVQLLEKQKVATYYNITETQLKKTFRLALKNKKMNSGVSLIANLERRLDQIVYKLGFAPTIFSARQIVSHKHVLVDGQTVNVASYLLKPGQEVSIRQKSHNIAIISTNRNRELPSYLKLNSDFSGTLLKVPTTLEEVPFPFEVNPSAIVEKYSKVL